MYAVDLAVFQDLSGTQDGGALDVVQAAQAVDAGDYRRNDKECQRENHANKRATHYEQKFLHHDASVFLINVLKFG